MHPQPQLNRFSRPTIALHWVMLIVLAVVYGCMELRELLPRGSSPREAMKAAHFMLGLSVLLLVALRIAARLRGPTPSILPTPSKLQQLLGHAVHLALYAFMIGMPIAGWLILSAEGKPIPFFGLELPPLVAANEALAHDIEELHELGGTLGYWLIGIHAVAALIHHYVQRDNTLRRMLPGVRAER